MLSADAISRATNRFFVRAIPQSSSESRRMSALRSDGLSRRTPMTASRRMPRSNYLRYRLPMPGVTRCWYSIMSIVWSAPRSACRFPCPRSCNARRSSDYLAERFDSLSSDHPLIPIASRRRQISSHGRPLAVSIIRQACVNTLMGPVPRQGVDFTGS